MKKLIFFIASALIPAYASCAWERSSSSDAPLAVIYATAGTYQLAYTVGEACAGTHELRYGDNSIWSGYLSLVPSDIPNKGFGGFEVVSGTQVESALWGAPPDDSVKLLFSTDISGTLSNPDVKVVQISSHTGAQTNAAWPVTVQYSGKKLVIVPSLDWPKGSLFSIYYSSSVIDINGYPLSGATTVYMSVVMDYAKDNVAPAVYDRRVKVLIPSNAYSEDFYLTLSTGTDKPEIRTANSKLPTLPGSPEFLSSVSAKSYNAAGVQTQPNSACVVTLPYPDTDGNDLIDGSVSRLKATDLSVWLLDEIKGLWIKQTGASLSTVDRKISLPVRHFSNYAVMGVPDTDLTPVYAYPVPFRPNAGDAARYGDWARGITFTQLPAFGTIKIYTIGGSLVRTLDIIPPEVKWDVKNSSGETVASGVYLWEVTISGKRKTGKLIVVK